MMGAVLALMATNAGAQPAPMNLLHISRPIILEYIVEQYGFVDSDYAFTLEAFSELVFGGRLDTLLAALGERPALTDRILKQDRLRVITLIVHKDGTMGWYALEPNPEGTGWQLEETPMIWCVMTNSHIITRGYA